MGKSLVLFLAFFLQLAAMNAEAEGVLGNQANGYCYARGFAYSCSGGNASVTVYCCTGNTTACTVTQGGVTFAGTHSGTSSTGSNYTSSAVLGSAIVNPLTAKSNVTTSIIANPQVAHLVGH